MKLGFSSNSWKKAGNTFIYRHFQSSKKKMQLLMINYILYLIIIILIYELQWKKRRDTVEKFEEWRNIMYKLNKIKNKIKNKNKIKVGRGGGAL